MSWQQLPNSDVFSDKAMTNINDAFISSKEMWWLFISVFKKTWCNLCRFKCAVCVTNCAAYISFIHLSTSFPIILYLCLFLFILVSFRILGLVNFRLMQFSKSQCSRSCIKQNTTEKGPQVMSEGSGWSSSSFLF